MQIDALKALGKEWQKDQYHRIYFNDLEKWYGLEYSTYKTGNISGAALHGAHLSNTKARSILSTLSLGKVWFDLTDNTFHSKGVPEDMADVIIDAITQAATQAAPHTERSSVGHTQLWQACYCGTEPVCGGCERCDRHCTCRQTRTDRAQVQAFEQQYPGLLNQIERHHELGAQEHE